MFVFFFFKQKTAYEMRISDWSSDVCSSDLEAAESMVTMNRYSITYARALVAATPIEQIVAGRRKSFKGLTDEQIALMERETANLDREFKKIGRASCRERVCQYV